MMKEEIVRFGVFAIDSTYSCRDSKSVDMGIRACNRWLTRIAKLRESLFRYKALAGHLQQIFEVHLFRMRTCYTVNGPDRCVKRPWHRVKRAGRVLKREAAVRELFLARYSYFDHVDPFCGDAGLAGR